MPKLVGSTRYSQDCGRSSEPPLARNLPRILGGEAESGLDDRSAHVDVPHTGVGREDAGFAQHQHEAGSSSQGVQHRREYEPYFTPKVYYPTQLSAPGGQPDGPYSLTTAGTPLTATGSQHSLSRPAYNLYATQDDFRGAPSGYYPGSGPTGRLPATSPLGLAQSRQPVPPISLHVYTGLDALATPGPDSRRGSFGGAGPWPAGGDSSATDFGEPSGVFSPPPDHDLYSGLEVNAAVPEHLSQAERNLVVQHGLSSSNAHPGESPVPVVSQAKKRKRKADDTIDTSARPAKKKRTPEQRKEMRRLDSLRTRHKHSDGVQALREFLGKDRSFSKEKTLREGW
ncbi:hypothetical protein BV25DRAFT_1919791 [Artomyces pyxidatus]|uniref:Uncharacterized protein n=1 Tax=Artomyces pyxidatus TaxID=48021 RepID=A0ACB8SNI5_9AGAM|nr:hypothetical protein BV25DRAFT_1919791 [Artomyces pyxidatus]